MPLIYCPNCHRIVYAYPRYDDTGAITSYRCSNCYNVYNYDQVNTILFPNKRIILNSTFAEIVSWINNIDLDKLLEKDTRKIAEDFIYILKYLCRPDEVNILKWRLVQWDYRGIREADKNNEELFEKIQREFAEYVDKGCYVIEICEPDEGDSIFIAISSDDYDKIIHALKLHNLILVM